MSKERDERVGRLVRAREAKTLLFDVNAYECEEYGELCKALMAFDGEYESPEGRKGE